MKTFRYKARDKTGLAVDGAIESESKEDAIRRLVRREIYPSGIEEETPTRKLDFDIFSGVPDEEVIVFTMRLGTMLKAGIPLGSCLSSLSVQTKNKKLKSAVTETKSMVEEGQPLSEALARQPDIFNKVYTTMIAAGEYAGALDRTLERLTRMLDRERETREKARQSLRYPKLVLAALALAVAILMGYVVPRFVTVFDEANMPLPLATTILLTLTHLVSWLWPVILAGAGGGYYAFHRFTSSVEGRYKWGEFLLWLPEIGVILMDINMARWSNALGNLVRSGAPIMESIRIASQTLDNGYLAVELSGMASSVSEGSGLAEPMRKIRHVSDTIIPQMIASGEQAGALDETLFTLCDYFDKEVERKVKRLAIHAEVGLIVMVGAMVMTLALGVFMPMWDMADLARGK